MSFSPFSSQQVIPIRPPPASYPFLSYLRLFSTPATLSSRLMSPRFFRRGSSVATTVVPETRSLDVFFLVILKQTLLDGSDFSSRFFLLSKRERYFCDTWKYAGPRICLHCCALFQLDVGSNKWSVALIVEKLFRNTYTRADADIHHCIILCKTIARFAYSFANVCRRCSNNGNCAGKLKISEHRAMEQCCTVAKEF